ncbi:hypothetical protein ACFLU6_03935 [Acidobacteriota bacterium]
MKLDTGRTYIVLEILSLVIFAGLLLGALIHTEFLAGPYYGDEARFFRATLDLIPFSIEKIAAIKEPSAPTFYLVFSFLIQITGNQIAWCRLIVLACLVGSVLTYRAAALEVTRRHDCPRALAPLSLMLLLTFPYLIGCGVVYYSDVPALFFLLLACRAWLAGKTGRTVLWSALALHCRQFAVFFPAGALAFELWRAWRTRDRKKLWWAWIWLIPPITLMPYALAGRNPFLLRSGNPASPFLPFVKPWQVSYLLAVCGLYLLPLAVILGRRRWGWKKLASVSAGLMFFFVFMPRPNVYFEISDTPIRTLGFMDRALQAACGRTGEMFILAGGMILAMVLHCEIFVQPRAGPALDSQVISGTARHRGFPWMIMAFWGVNLFGTVVWDKYLLLVLPFIFLAALTHPAFCKAKKNYPGKRML